MAELYRATKVWGLVFAGVIALTPLCAQAASASPVVIDMHDGIVRPHQITVAAGDTVTVTVRNTGKVPVEFESLQLRQERVLVSGQKYSFTLRGLLPGVYPFFDDFHSGSGRGVLVVK